MKWFINEFLVSLEERYRKSGKLWLTQKQANVCKRYMVPSSSVRGCYTFDCNGNHYRVQVAPSGCAAFFVSFPE